MRTRRLAERRREQQVPAVGPPLLHGAAEVDARRLGGGEVDRRVRCGRTRPAPSSRARRRRRSAGGRAGSPNAVDADRHARRPQRHEPRRERRVGEHRRRRRLDVVAEALQQRRRGADGLDAVVVDPLVARMVVEQPDPQRPGIGADLVGVRADRAAAAITVSPTPGPRVASSRRAVSRTVRLTQCSTPRPASARSGPSEIRPWLTLSPTSPQHDAGMRIEPPPSEAWAIGTMPGGDRGRRAAARSARRAVEVPRVAGRPARLRLGGRQAARARGCWCARRSPARPRGSGATSVVSARRRSAAPRPAPRCRW